MNLADSQFTAATPLWLEISWQSINVHFIFLSTVITYKDVHHQFSPINSQQPTTFSFTETIHKNTFCYTMAHGELCESSVTCCVFELHSMYEAAPIAFLSSSPCTSTICHYNAGRAGHNTLPWEWLCSKHGKSLKHTNLQALLPGRKQNCLSIYC
jgi:hypothetical protein